MFEFDKKNIRVCVVGLGYVGLPLAIEFSKNFNTLGFDVSKKRVSDLRDGVDSTEEVATKDLKNSGLVYTKNQEDIKSCNFIVVAVPTPITEEKKPDLKYIESASRIVGKNLSKGSIVVFESTVYPGVTEDICLPILEKESNLKCGSDFKIGYSPERINPGDKEHTIDKVIKVVSGLDEQSLNIIDEVYSKIAKAGVFKAASIKTAESAKVIENIQRDLNIALINELSLIFDKLGLDTNEVLDAASTKWNFQRYTPGLVGGHCIGVDPYYLTYIAEKENYVPKIILAGRDLNNSMPVKIGGMLIEMLKKAGKNPENSKVLVLGLTFKENIPDTRNSKVKDLVGFLNSNKVHVIAYDPFVDQKTSKEKFNVDNVEFDRLDLFDGVILAVPHAEFNNIKLESLSKKMNPPVLLDIKSFFNKKKALELGFIYKSL